MCALWNPGRKVACGSVALYNCTGLFPSSWDNAILTKTSTIVVFCLCSAPLRPVFRWLTVTAFHSDPSYPSLRVRLLAVWKTSANLVPSRGSLRSLSAFPHHRSRYYTLFSSFWNAAVSKTRTPWNVRTCIMLLLLQLLILPLLLLLQPLHGALVCTLSTTSSIILSTVSFAENCVEDVFFNKLRLDEGSRFACWEFAAKLISQSIIFWKVLWIRRVLPWRRSRI